MTNEQQIIIKIKADSEKAVKEIASLNKQVKSLSKNSKASTQKISNLNKGFASTKATLAGVGASILSFNAIKGLVSDFGELEQGMVDVAKTTGLSGKELKKLDDGLVTMSQRLKGVSVRELTDIAETAGQLGISGTKDILTFSEAISKIAVATDLSAHEASASMAVLSNILKEPIANTERLGSVINELSNTSEASAKNIVDFAKRIAASGKTFGLTSAQIFALGATLKGVGASAEAGGSAVSRLMGLMAGNIAGFAKASGKSFEEFKSMVINKPMEALKLFIGQMGKLNKLEQPAVFHDLKLNSIEVRKTIQLLSGSMGKLDKNLKNASDEYKRNTSLQIEYATASKSLDSAFKDINNEADILKKRLGQQLSSSIKDITAELIKFMQTISATDIKGFADGIKSLFTLVRDLGGALASLNDLAMPDWLAGEKNAGVLGETAKGWKLIAGGIEDFVSGTDRANEKMKQSSADTASIANEILKSANIIKQSSSIAQEGIDTSESANVLSHYRDEIKLTSAEIDNYKKKISEMIRANTDRIQSINESAADVRKYKDQISEIRKNIDDEIKLMNELSSLKPYKDVAQDSGDAKKSIEQVTSSIKTSTEEYKKSDNERVSSHKKAIDEINTSEKKLSDKKIEIKVTTEKATGKIKKLSTIKTKSKHTVVIDASRAIRTINRLKRRTKSTHTIYVEEVRSPHFASGGSTRYSGKIKGHDLSGKDDINAKLTRGEFIQNVRAVDYYGSSFMERLNNLSIPKFELPTFATGGLVGGDSGTKGTVNLNLNIGNKTFSTISDEEVAKSLASYLQRNEF